MFVTVSQFPAALTRATLSLSLGRCGRKDGDVVFRLATRRAASASASASAAASTVHLRRSLVSADNAGVSEQAAPIPKNDVVQDAQRRRWHHFEELGDGIVGCVSKSKENAAAAALPVPVHNRWYCSTRFSKPTYVNLPTPSFPRVFKFTGETKGVPLSEEAVAEMRDVIGECLSMYGALLFRNMQHSTVLPETNSDATSEESSEPSSFGPQDLDMLTSKLGLEKLAEYRSGLSVRSREAEDTDVFQASDEPPQLTMEPHTEMAYLEDFPATFFMYCEHPAECGGGESLVCHTRRVSDWMLRGIRPPTTMDEEETQQGSTVEPGASSVGPGFVKFGGPGVFTGPTDEQLARIGPDSEFVKRLVVEGCRYEFWWPHEGYMDWRTQLRTNDRETAERLLQEQGLSFTWLPAATTTNVAEPGTGTSSEEGDTDTNITKKEAAVDLLAWVVRPVVGHHPDTKELLWLNQVGPAHRSYQDNHPTHCQDRPYPGFYLAENADVRRFDELVDFALDLDQQYDALGLDEENGASASDTDSDPGSSQAHQRRRVIARPGRRAMSTCYANGEAFPQATVDALRALTFSSSIGVQLQEGDLLVLDNFLTMHGRFPYRPESFRKLYVALCNIGKWHKPL